MKSPPLLFNVFVSMLFALVTLLTANRSIAQLSQDVIYVSSEQITDGAKKEGKLFLHSALRPEYDKVTVPDLLKAFGKKYPFIQPTWGVSEMGPRPNLKAAVTSRVEEAQWRTN